MRRARWISRRCGRGRGRRETPCLASRASVARRGVVREVAPSLPRDLPAARGRPRRRRARTGRSRRAAPEAARQPGSGGGGRGRGSRSHDLLGSLLAVSSASRHSSLAMPAERLRRLVAHHTVLALVAEHSLEGRHRARDLHLTKRERHLVAEQRARILEAVQERLHRRFAADAAQAEERAEATRHGKRLVQELGAQCLDAHGEGDGRGRGGVGRRSGRCGASTGGPSRSLAHAKARAGRLARGDECASEEVRAAATSPRAADKPRIIRHFLV